MGSLALGSTEGKVSENFVRAVAEDGHFKKDWMRHGVIKVRQIRLQKSSISFTARRLRLLLLFWLQHASGQAGEGRNPTQIPRVSFILFLPCGLLDPGAQPCSFSLCGCNMPLPQPNNLKLTKCQLKTGCSDHQICSAFVAFL